MNISVTERILCASPDRSDGPHGGALLSVSQAGRRLVRVLRFLCTEQVHILFGPKKTNPAALSCPQEARSISRRYVQHSLLIGQWLLCAGRHGCSSDHRLCRSRSNHMDPQRGVRWISRQLDGDTLCHLCVTASSNCCERLINKCPLGPKDELALVVRGQKSLWPIELFSREFAR